MNWKNNLLHSFLQHASWFGGLIDYIYVYIDWYWSGLHFAQNGFKFDSEVGDLLFKGVTTLWPSLEIVWINETKIYTTHIQVDCEFDSPITDEFNLEYDRRVKDWFKKSLPC